ncbi:hypothetical protein SBA2_10118 [Acidobacteriia bacterium SbA2]|nr:hypothetical protein SBA2_10118 [Acidobacteriia bacterium SbA2]
MSSPARHLIASRQRFRKPAVTCRQIINQPMDKGSRGSVRIVLNDGETLCAGWRIAPRECGRHIRGLAGEALGYETPWFECSGFQFNLRSLLPAHPRWDHEHNHPQSKQRYYDQSSAEQERSAYVANDFDHFINPLLKATPCVSFPRKRESIGLKMGPRLRGDDADFHCLGRVNGPGPPLSLRSLPLTPDT